MHSVSPAWLLYLPAAHRTQVPPLGPDEPALHAQASAESLPDGEFARAGQLASNLKATDPELPVPHRRMCQPIRSLAQPFRQSVSSAGREKHAGVPPKAAIHPREPYWTVHTDGCLEFEAAIFISNRYGPGTGVAPHTFECGIRVCRKIT